MKNKQNNQRIPQKKWQKGNCTHCYCQSTSLHQMVGAYRLHKKLNYKKKLA